MHTYFFQLGNTPALSLQELRSVFGEKTVTSVTELLAQVALPEDANVQEIIEILGGTVKIMRVIRPLTETEPEEIEAAITEHLTQLAAETNNKIHFAVSELHRDHKEPLESHTIKAQLQAAGVHTRYADGSRHGLSAAILLHKKKVVEVIVVSTESQTLLCQTVAIQDIDDWTHKDRNKPYADSKKGMLPPKVALMMVNIAMGDNPRQPDRVNLLLDPFCGTGTVLIEGILAKLPVIGSDLDAAATTGSRTNLDWIAQNYAVEDPYEVILSDATKIPKQKHLVQYIVTEPFLGKQKPNAAKLPFVFKGLEKLYLGAFKHWTTLLADGASVVIIFPAVAIENKHGKTITYNLESLIDKLAQFGYTTLSEPILYHRPQAVVQRQIYRFRFNKA